MLTPTIQASVVLNGTRVIYPAGSASVNLHFSNLDDHPNVLQVWVSAADTAGSVDSADPRLLVSPEVFRINAHAGQVARLSYLGPALPDDQESVFYLNFSQIPALTEASRGQNKLVLVFTSRVKVLYRPTALSGAKPALDKTLIAHVDAARRQVLLTNPTGYYLSVRAGSLEQAGRTLPLTGPTLIAPKASVHWKLPAGITAGPAVLRLSTINDYGVDVETCIGL